MLVFVGIVLSVNGVKNFINDMIKFLVDLGVQLFVIDMFVKVFDGWVKLVDVVGLLVVLMSLNLQKFQSLIFQFNFGFGVDDMFNIFFVFSVQIGIKFDIIQNVS